MQRHHERLEHGVAFGPVCTSITRARSRHLVLSDGRVSSSTMPWCCMPRRASTASDGQLSVWLTAMISVRPAAQPNARTACAGLRWRSRGPTSPGAGASRSRCRVGVGQGEQQDGADDDCRPTCAMAQSARRGACAQPVAAAYPRDGLVEVPRRGRLAGVAVAEPIHRAAILLSRSSRRAASSLAPRPVTRRSVSRCTSGVSSQPTEHRARRRCPRGTPASWLTTRSAPR